MNEQELQRNLMNDSFNIHLDINVDIKQNKSSINIKYFKSPQNLKFMCASLLLQTATRILWIAKSSQNDEIIDLYRQFQEISNSIKLINTPLNNKFIKISSIGTINEYSYNLDYKGFAFGGLFAKDIPIITLYSFLALFKYINTVLLPLEKNKEFYDDLMSILNNIIYYRLENVTQIEMRQMCMGYSISLAYEDMEE